MEPVRNAKIKAVRFIANNIQGFFCNWGYDTLTEMPYIYIYIYIYSFLLWHKEMHCGQQKLLNVIQIWNSMWKSKEIHEIYTPLRDIKSDFISATDFPFDLEKNHKIIRWEGHLNYQVYVFAFFILVTSKRIWLNRLKCQKNRT